MIKAVHIYLSHFLNDSRILKETKSLIDNHIVDEVVVIALGKDGLSDFEQFGENRYVRRVQYKFMRDKKPIRGLYRLSRVIQKIDFIYRLILSIKNERPSYINLHQVSLLPLIPIIKILQPKVELIYDAHELETETSGLKGFRKVLFKFYEKIFIKSFRLIIVVSPSIEKWYRNKYGISNIITVMNCPYYQKVEKQDLFREEFGISADSKIFLYQGALFFGRGIDVLLEAFSEINNPKFTIIFMGYGEMEDEVRKYASLYSNIFFKNAVHPSIVLIYTSSADVGISLIQNVCLSYYYCLPNKLFEYLMAELPCIVSNMDEMTKYVNENGVGIVSKYATKESLIKSIFEMEKFNMQFFKKNVEIIKHKYSWSSQESIMISAYKRFLSSNFSYENE